MAKLRLDPSKGVLSLRAVTSALSAELAIVYRDLLDQAKVITGLTGEDDAVSFLIDDTGSDTRAALDDVIDGAIADAAVRVPGNLDYFHARLSVPGPVRVMMLGSSTPFGSGASAADRGVTNRLAAAFQRAYPSGVTLWEPPVVTANTIAFPPSLPGIHFANGAFGGATSATYIGGGVPTWIGLDQPDIVFHMVGSNDYSTDVAPATVQANLIAAATAVNAALYVGAIHVFLGTYAPPAKTSPTYPWSQYLAAMKAAAAAVPGGIFLDPSAPFVTAFASGPSAPDPLNLIAADNTHPTDAGHALLASEFVEQLELPAPGPTALLPEVYDRFARKTLGAAETGQAWAEQSTAVHVPNGQYLTVTTLGNAVVDPGFSDVDVSAVCTVATGAVSGIIAKSTDNNTRIGWYLQPATNMVQLYQGATFLDQAAVTLTGGREVFLRLVVQGSLVKGYVNGALMLTHTLASPGSYGTYTQHGVRANATTGSPTWRNFAARRM